MLVIRLLRRTTQLYFKMLNWCHSKQRILIFLVNKQSILIVYAIFFVLYLHFFSPIEQLFCNIKSYILDLYIWVLPTLVIYKYIRSVKNQDPIIRTDSTKFGFIQNFRCEEQSFDSFTKLLIEVVHTSQLSNAILGDSIPR